MCDLIISTKTVETFYTILTTRRNIAVIMRFFEIQKVVYLYAVLKKTMHIKIE